MVVRVGGPQSQNPIEKMIITHYFLVSEWSCCQQFYIIMLQPVGHCLVQLGLWICWHLVHFQAFPKPTME